MIAAAALAAASSSARADDTVTGIAGVYDIKIDEMADNCSPPPVALQNKTIRLDLRAGVLLVNLETVPQLAGSAAKNGKLSAKTAKVMPTTVQGLDGKYTIAGHVTVDKAIELVLVAEYSIAKKPYCTQSWTIAGKKQAAAAATTK